MGVDIMRTFAAMRPDTARKHFMKKFAIAGTNTLVISRSNPDYGKIYTHGVEAAKNGFTHVFFRNITMTIKAVAAPGCRFVRWQGVIATAVPETTILLSSNSTVTAVFASAGVEGISSSSASAPGEYILYDNFPNPFNPSTTIRFSIPTADDVSVKVFDMLGQEIESLADGHFTPGIYSVRWNTQGLSSGVYFCRLRSSRGTESRKMLLTK